MRVYLATAALLFIGACGGEAPPADSEPAAELPGTDTAAHEPNSRPDTPQATSAAPVRMWSREALSVQPRMYELQQRVPPALGYTPGTTSWRQARIEIPADLTAPASLSGDPGSLLDRLARTLGWNDVVGGEAWEQTRRLWQNGDEAEGVVLLWGFRDDALAGQDYRVAMQRGERGWYVERVEARFHCSRGVSEDGLCL